LAVFFSGAITSWTVYGHAGPLPVPLLLVVKADGQYLPWALWMIASGLCMVVLFGWLSYRRSRARAV
jgi:hypothetical protein